MGGTCSSASTTTPPEPPLLAIAAAPAIPNNATPSAPTVSDAATVGPVELASRGISLRCVVQFLSDHPWVAAEGITSAEVIERVIKPETAHKRCAYLDMLAAVDPLAAGKPTHFVSHAWKYRFADVIDALRVYAEQPDAVGAVREPYLWFDIFVINQHEACLYPKEFWTMTFHASIGSIHHTLLVTTPWSNPVALTRAWCLWELLGTALYNCRLTLLLAGDQREAFLRALTHDYDSIITALCKIDSRNAEAFDPTDRAMIFSAVENGPGFDKLNETVLGRIRQWLSETGKVAVQQLEARRSLLPQQQQQRQHPSTTSDSGAQVEAKGWEDAAAVLGQEMSGLLGSVGRLLQDQSQFDEALQFLQRAVDEARAAWGPQDAHTAAALVNLGRCLHDLARYQEAEEVYREAVTAAEAALGPNALVVADALNLLAFLYHHLARFHEAVELCERALAIREAAYGEGTPHAAVCETINNLANAHRSLNDPHKARPLYEKSCAMRERLYGENHPAVALGLSNLANIMLLTGDAAAALPLHERVLAMRRKTLGPTHVQVGTSLKNVGLARQAVGDMAGAEESLREALALRLLQFAELHPKCAESYATLGDLYVAEGGRDADALAAYRKAHAGWEAAHDGGHPFVVRAAEYVVLLETGGSQALKGRPPLATFA